MGKRLFTGSTQGLGILINTTASSGQVIDQSTTGMQNLYNVRCANHNTTAAHTLSIGFGGTTDPDHIITKSIPAATEVPVSVVSGLILAGVTKNVRMWGTTDNALVVYGDVLEFE